MMRRQKFTRTCLKEHNFKIDLSRLGVNFSLINVTVVQRQPTKHKGSHTVDV